MRTVRSGSRAVQRAMPSARAGGVWRVPWVAAPHAAAYAARMRKRTGAVVCPECGKLVDVSEPKCPYCGRPAPGLFGYGPVLQRLLGGFDLSFAIVAACTALYVVALLIHPGTILRMAGLFDILAPTNDALIKLGMTGRSVVAYGHWWTLLTAVFLHGSLLHLLFNMAIGRRYLADVVHLYGPPRAWVIFIVAGVVGFALSSLATDVPTIGASGSIFGLLGALIVYGRRTHQHAVAQQLWMSAGVMFLFGFLMPSVNNWAHAGGFAGGFVAAEAVSFAGRRESRTLLAVAWGSLLLVVLAFGLQLSWWFATVRLGHA
jgi:rhomboid protease GluP